MEQMDSSNTNENIIPSQDTGEGRKEKVIEVVTSSSIFKYFLGAMIIFGICFVTCIFVFQVLLSSITVVGVSMQPTINASVTGVKHDVHTDTVFCYRTNDVKYKDIVIIDETKTGDKIIKRVIGEPGQTITFKRTNSAPPQSYYTYDIYIDNVKLEEDYTKDLVSKLEDKIWTAPYTFYNELLQGVKKGSFSITLKENEFFVMGDNRNESTDSRYFGPITRDEIVGKVVLQVRYGQTIFSAIWHLIF